MKGKGRVGKEDWRRTCLNLKWRWEELGGGESRKQGDRCWRRVGAIGKGRKVSGVREGILEREGVLDGKCEVEVGSQNEMLIGMRKEAYLGRDQR